MIFRVGDRVEWSNPISRKKWPGRGTVVRVDQDAEVVLVDWDEEALAVRTKAVALRHVDVVSRLGEIS